MIRVLHLSRLNLQSGRTNVYNFVKTCEALQAQEGFQVRMITTDQSRDVHSSFARLGVHQPFPIDCLGITDTSTHVGGRWYELLMFFLANVYLVGVLSRQSIKFDAIYFRDEFLFPAALWARVVLNKKTFFEVHSVLENKLRQSLNVAAARTVSGVVAISGGLKQHYERMNRRILLSLCSAAEPAWFDYDTPLALLRPRLALPESAFLIGYAGVVGANPNNDYYELDEIVKSLKLLPSEIMLVIVGEMNGNAAWLRSIADSCGLADQVIILPWQERQEIPKYLRAFDLILIPRRKKDLVGDSPAKMFTALAARRPIVAGRAECIEEVLTDSVNALIVEENTPAGWAKAILTLYHDQAKGKMLAAEAFAESAKYTWDKRGREIAHFIRKITNKV